MTEDTFFWLQKNKFNTIFCLWILFVPIIVYSKASQPFSLYGNTLTQFTRPSPPFFKFATDLPAHKEIYILCLPKQAQRKSHHFLDSIATKIWEVNEKFEVIWSFKKQKDPPSSNQLMTLKLIRAKIQLQHAHLNELYTFSMRYSMD